MLISYSAYTPRITGRHTQPIIQYSFKMVTVYYKAQVQSDAGIPCSRQLTGYLQHVSK